MKMFGKGWFRDNWRHSLAAKGIKTSFSNKKNFQLVIIPAGLDSEEKLEFEKRKWKEQKELLEEQEAYKEKLADIASAMEERKKLEEAISKEPESGLRSLSIFPEGYDWEQERIDRLNVQASDIKDQLKEIIREELKARKEAKARADRLKERRDKLTGRKEEIKLEPLTMKIPKYVAKYSKEGPKFEEVVFEGVVAPEVGFSTDQGYYMEGVKAEA